MKVKGTKRGLAVLLALSMTLCAISLSANAAVPAEVEYSLDGGATWIEQDYLANALFNCYLNKNSIIRLKRDITLDSSTWALPIAALEDSTLTLDGAGHTIYRGNVTGGFLLLSQTNSHVILKDITLDGGAVWNESSDVTGRTNSGKSQGGNCQFFYLKDHTTLTLDSGTVLRNNHLNGKVNGAAVWLEGGTMIMKDGAKIINNTATGTNGYGGAGGAVQIDGGAAFYMEGGEISGNYASTAAGAVYVESDGVFAMTGGAIRENAAGNNSGAVGGQAGYQVKLTGGTITGNKALYGGALLPWDMVEVGGNIRITGNQTPDGTENNVYLYSPDKYLTISGALSGQAKIGITSKTLPAENTPVLLAAAGNGYTITDADKAKLYHDGGAYAVVLANGCLQMQLAMASDDRDTIVTANTTIPAPVYTITIPEKVDMGELSRTEEDAPDKIASKALTLTASDVENLFGEKKIAVTAAAPDGAFRLTDGTNQLAYSVYAPDSPTALASGGVFTEFTGDQSKTGRIEVDQSTIRHAGTFTGTITFTISLVDIA